jgi:hypothetical protein
MKKAPKDPVRENRIENEATVDAYGSGERAVGWYTYLDEKMRFPFRATCVVSKPGSPLRKGDAVDVRRVAPDDICSEEILVMVRWQGRTVAVPLAQLAGIDVDEPTGEAIADWHYWVGQGYLF